MRIEQTMVEDFHLAMKQPVETVPTLIPRERSELRYYLIGEELFEYGEAIDAENIVEIADALGDLLYVVLGTAVEHGIDMKPIFAEIHASNMSKLDGNGEPVPHPTIPGKAGKSENYWPPRLDVLLEEQGWRE